MEITIDKLSSYDFIARVFDQVEPQTLRKLGVFLEKKSARFKLYFDISQIDQLDREKLLYVLGSVFSVHRKAKKWSDELITDFIANTKQLLYDEKPLEEKFNAFCDFAGNELLVKKPFELASEILHFSNPLKYHLWGKWMWDPKEKTGGIPLMVNEDFHLDDMTYGQQYLIIGKVIHQVDKIAHEIGIREPGNPKTSDFEVDIFICAIFAVYMYTVTRMRMTKEFNTILPSMIELTERLLGVYYIKGEEKQT